MYIRLYVHTLTHIYDIYIYIHTYIHSIIGGVKISSRYPSNNDITTKKSNFKPPIPSKWKHKQFKHFNSQILSTDISVVFYFSTETRFPHNAVSGPPALPALQLWHRTGAVQPRQHQAARFLLHLGMPWDSAQWRDTSLWRSKFMLKITLAHTIRLKHVHDIYI